MKDNKTLYVICDYDGTFEEVENGDGTKICTYKNFEDCLKKLSAELNLPVKFGVCGGISKQNFELLCHNFEDNYCDLTKMMAISIVENDQVFYQTRFCEHIFKFPPQCKEDAFCELIDRIGKFNMAGLVYIGDCAIDTPIACRLEEMGKQGTIPFICSIAVKNERVGKWGNYSAKVRNALYDQQNEAYEMHSPMEHSTISVDEPKLAGCIQGLEKAKDMFKEKIFGTELN